jgi:hypothetical protein
MEDAHDVKLTSPEQEMNGASKSQINLKIQFANAASQEKRPQKSVETV